MSGAPWPSRAAGGRRPAAAPPDDEPAGGGALRWLRTASAGHPAARLAVAAAVLWPFLPPTVPAHRPATVVAGIVLVGLAVHVTWSWLRVVLLAEPAAAALGGVACASALARGQSLLLAVLLAAGAGAALLVAVMAPTMAAGMRRPRPAAAGAGLRARVGVPTSVGLGTTALVSALLLPRTAERPVVRPVLLGIDLAGDRPLYVLTALAVLGLAVGIRRLESRGAGRAVRLVGLSPALAAATGVRALPAAVAGAAVAGSLAGAGGAFVAVAQRHAPGPATWSPLVAVLLLAVPLVAGRRSTATAVASGAVVAGLPVALGALGVRPGLGQALVLGGAAALPHGVADALARLDAARAGWSERARSASTSAVSGAPTGAGVHAPSTRAGQRGAAASRRAVLQVAVAPASDRGAVSRAMVAAGGHAVLQVNPPLHPSAVLEAVAGLRGRARVVLDGEDLSEVPAEGRAAAGLATAGGVPWPSGAPVGFTVLDLLVTARQACAGRAHGSRGDRPAVPPARTPADDEAPPEDEAYARSLAGRCGLGAWTDVDLGLLPPPVAALADLARARAMGPRALVHVVPAGLDADATAAVRAVAAIVPDPVATAVLEVAAAS